MSPGEVLGQVALCLVIGYLLADWYCYAVKGDTFTKWVIREKNKSPYFKTLVLVILFGGALLLAEHFEVFRNG